VNRRHGVGTVASGSMERRAAADGLTLKAYRGDGAALLAFDVDESLSAQLAGFAIQYTPPGGDPKWLFNRLTFDDPITAATTPDQRRQISTPTNLAPIQKFHWSHFPSSPVPGDFTYTATAMLFKSGSERDLEPGPTASVQIDLLPQTHPNFQLGFTRGYVSSQAYANRFGNAPIAPSPAPIDFDTAPFQPAYEWLGFDARKLIFGILDEAVNDPDTTLDVFAYDLDEPDVISKLQALGPRLRIFMDDAKLHTKPNAEGVLPQEVDAHNAFVQSAGTDNVKVGHFSRFAHSKVLILKRAGRPVKVLAGSANFSVRGLYVQTNNVFVFDDEQAAALHEQAFEQAWNHPLSQFDTSDIAAQWFPLTGDGLPACSLSFSPHPNPGVSLDPIAQAIQGAQSSVLFSIMEIGASSGVVADQIRGLPQRKGLYAFGTTQKLDGALKVTTPADPSSPFIPFDYLQSKVPPPFQAEVSGGAGQVIHNKFVVCDFNDASPVVYAGSSNLAAGGELDNGDNLAAFTDREVATAYAVQAIELVDHYRFRAVQQAATTAQPLRLKRASEHWAADFFDPSSPRFLERELFVRPAPSA
jgi:PLD-like domain